jgi:FixJ family two-component response regulator
MSSTVSFFEECDSRQGTSGSTLILLADPETDRSSKVAPHSPLVSIVDDESLVLRSLARLIKAAGFRVVTFGSAEEFLESGKVWEVACVILDVGLPGMNGLDLQAQLVAQSCPVPIVFVTARDDEAEKRAQAVRNGAVAFVGKPLNDEALIDAIRSALKRN